MTARTDENAGREKLRRLSGLLILILAAVALVVGLYRESRTISPAPDRVEDQPAVLVRYLHGNKRCSTCQEIEARTAALVQDRFAEDVQAGELAFVSTNYDLPEDRHFLADYDLAFGNVVVESREAGFRKVDEVWDLVMEDSQALEDKLAEVIRSFLEPPP